MSWRDSLKRSSGTALYGCESMWECDSRSCDWSTPSRGSGDHQARALPGQVQRHLLLLHTVLPQERPHRQDGRQGLCPRLLLRQPWRPLANEERIDRAVQELEERRAEIAGNRSVEQIALKTRPRWRWSRLWWR